MVKLYVRIAKTALGWQKMPFRGVRWGLGASHTSAPITLTWSGRRLRVFFIVSRAIAKVNDDAEKGIMPKEEEQGKIQNLMGEVLADNLPLKMRKMAFSLNLGFLKVSVETTRGKD